MLGQLDVLVYTPEEFERMRREGDAFVEMLEEGWRIDEREATGRSPSPVSAGPL